jgi:hypothetical protein
LLETVSNTGPLLNIYRNNMTMHSLIVSGIDTSPTLASLHIIAIATTITKGGGGGVLENEIEEK